MLARPKKYFLCVKYNPKGSYVGFNSKILAIKFPAAKMWRNFFSLLAIGIMLRSLQDCFLISETHGIFFSEAKL